MLIQRKSKIKPKIPLFLLESIFLLRHKRLDKDYFQIMWDERLSIRDRYKTICSSNKAYRKSEHLSKNKYHAQHNWNGLPNFLKNDIIDNIDFFADLVYQKIPDSAMILNLLSHLSNEDLYKLWENKDLKSIISVLILEFLYLNQQTDLNYIVEIVDHIESNVSTEFRYHNKEENLREVLEELEGEGYIDKERNGNSLSYHITDKGVSYYLNIREGVAKTLKEEFSLPIILKTNKIGYRTFLLQNPPFEIANMDDSIRINQKIRNLVNKQLSPYNNYFDTIPLDSILKILEKNGLIAIQNDGIKWSGLFLGDNSKANIKLAKYCIKNNEYRVVSNSSLIITWYKLVSGKYEIVTYIS